MERQDKKVYLDLNHAFGSNFSYGIRNSLGIIQQDGKMKLVYTVGKTIAKMNIHTSQMQFIKLTQNVEKIQCVAISPTRNHIAICQKLRNQNFLLLNLYGLKNKDSQIKHFRLPQTQKQSTFKAIAFSPSQPKYACCLTGQPDYQLIFLDVSRSRGLAVSNFSLQNAQTVAICPSQSHLISCSGKNIFRLFKVEDYSFKSYEDVKKLPKSRNFTVHSWFDKTKILVGTDRGQLFMIGPVGNNFEVKKHFTNIFAVEGQQVSVTSMCVFSNGFILGSNYGHFSLWMKQDETQQNYEDEYTGDLTKKWKVPDNRVSEIICIAICPKQQILAVSFANNSIAYTEIKKLTNDLQSQLENKNDVLTYIYDGFHTMGISSIDICIHRPIIATLSKPQNTIRLWNYKKPNCELIKRFDSKSDGIEDNSSQLLNCLALHPLGYYMAVGCCDKLRIYHILYGQLRNYRQIVLKAVCQLKFSNGGHMLAAAYPKQKYNIHQINIYNAYTLQEIGRLSDHSNLITDLCWKPYDKALISVGTDGNIMQWKQTEGKLDSKEWVCKKWTQNNSRYTSVIYDWQMKSIIVSGVEGARSIIREIRSEKDQVQKLSAISFKINKLKYFYSQWNVPAILGGTQDGTLNVFNSAFDNIVEQSLNVHSGQITKVQTSPCGRYVFTVGEDGNVFIYQVSLTNRQGYMNRRLHDSVSDNELNPLIAVLDDQLADIVLVQRNDVNEKIRYIKMLEKNLQEMKRKIDVQAQQQRRKYDQQLNKIAQEKQKKVNKLNQQLQKMKQIKKKLENQTQQNFKDLENKNVKMLEQIQVLYQKKLAIQNKIYLELDVKYQQEKINQEQALKAAISRREQIIKSLRIDFIDTFKKSEKIHESKQHQIIEGQKQFSQKVKQIQQEHQEQLKFLSEKIAKLEQKKSEQSASYTTGIQSLKRQNKLLDTQIVQLMSQNDTMSQILRQLRNQLKDIQRNIEKKKQDLIQKQQILKIKQEKIVQYQQRIDQLQKKKKVLSYRTWQMRQQIEPKQDEIQFLKEQLFLLEKQFENLLEQQKVRKEKQQKIKRQKQSYSQMLTKQKLITKDKLNKIKKISDHINQIVQSKNTNKNFYQEKIVELYKKYSGFMTDSIRLTQNSKGIDEMARHMQHLDKQINEHNQQTQIRKLRRDQQIQKSTLQNKDLINKVASLRQQKIKLNLQLKQIQNQLQKIKIQTNKYRNNIIKEPVESQFSIYKKSSIKNLPKYQDKRSMIRSTSQPLHKGKIVKGLNYDAQNLSIFARAKVKELENRLDNCKNQYRQKQLVLKILKSKVSDHIKDQNCKDFNLEKCLSDPDK